MRKAAVIIVAYKGKHWLPACVESLAHAATEPWSLVLVDNGDENAIDELDLSAFDVIRVKPAGILGFAEANNLALREIGLAYEAVCFLNQDTVSEPAWLQACLDGLSAQTEFGVVSPLLRTYDGSHWDPGFYDCARTVPSLLEGNQSSSHAAGFRECSRVTAAAVVVRSAALQRSGPFDPIFGSYYEDYDLCRRIRQSGYRVGICPRASVRHYSGSSTVSEEGIRKRTRQIIRNRAILRIREAGDHRWREIARYLTCTMPYNFGRSVFRTRSSHPLAVQFGAHWDLLRGWRRLVSGPYDQQVWTEYLRNIGWPHASQPIGRQFAPPFDAVSTRAFPG